jgi:hypothetical protein
LIKKNQESLIAFDYTKITKLSKNQYQYFYIRPIVTDSQKTRIVLSLIMALTVFANSDKGEDGNRNPKHDPTKYGFPLACGCFYLD